MTTRLLVPALLGLVLLLAVLVAGFDPAPVVADDDEAGIEWLSDLGEARAQARESGRPILAVFR